MGNRIFLVAAMLAGVALTATSASAAPAADECLAKPKGPAPAGKHWYYQTNRAVQRKCWYLDDEGEKTVAATPRKQSTSAINVNPDKGPACSRRPRTRVPSWLTSHVLSNRLPNNRRCRSHRPNAKQRRTHLQHLQHPMARVRVTGPLRRVGRTRPNRSPPRVRRRSTIPHRLSRIENPPPVLAAPRRSNSRPRLSTTPAAWTLPRSQPR